MPRPFLGLSALPVLAAALAAACESSGGSGGTEPGPTPAIAITVNPQSATVAQGGSTQVTATLTRSGGFTGGVSITVEGAPAGVAGQLSGEQTTGGVTSATVTILVGAAVPPGTYTLTVRGTGAGVTAATATFTLTVTAVETGTFQLSVNPDAVSIPQGGNGAVTLTIERTGGFQGQVALVVEGAPAGLTATLDPAATQGTTSAVALAVALGLAPGTYSLTIRGTSQGQPERTSVLQVTVTPGGNGGAGNVIVDYAACPPDQQPVWFAFQDGEGPWTRVAGNGQVYAFPLTSARGAFAAVMPADGLDQMVTSITFSTRGELTSEPLVSCTPGARKSVSGTIAGLLATEGALVSLGDDQTAVTGAPGPFELTRVLDGPMDLVAFRFPFLGGATPHRGIIRRDLNVPHMGSVGELDFNGPEAFDAASATITVVGLTAGETMAPVMNYFTGGAACHSHTLYGGLPVAANPFTAHGIPPARQRPTDLHSLFVSVARFEGMDIVEARGVMEFFPALGDRTMTLGPGITPPAITPLPAPYRRLQAVFPLPADYQAASFQYRGGTRTFVMFGSPGWVGGAAAVTIAPPDFTGADGWDNDWGPSDAGPVNWATGATNAHFDALGLCQGVERIILAQRMGML